MSVQGRPVEIFETISIDLEIVRQLFRAYAASLPFSLDFQGFATELAGLPGPYSPPGGCLLIAKQGDVAVGIVGLKPLAEAIAEIKRLYVIPEARGGGLGKQLAERAIAVSKAKGYERVRLDTHRPSMEAAIALYRGLGFVEIPPYGPNPDGQFAFFEKQLSRRQRRAILAARTKEPAMRLLIAMMKHETNTFSPVPTHLARFGPSHFDKAPGPLYGEAAISAYRGTGSGLGACLDLAERERADIVLPIAASAPPSRPVEDAAFDHMAGVICDAVAQGLKTGGYDGMFLDLHGAMVTESFEDGEGELLRRIRAIDPKTPIAVSLDMHANLYDAIVDNATVVTGYRTYPHIDTYDTAKRAGEILLRAMRGEVRPVIAWGNVPMLPHVMRQGSDDHPNKELQARCAAIASDAALDASLFTGFPHADITNAGLSAVVVTDGDKARAEKLRDELLDQAWKDREDFVYRLEPLEKSLARAKTIEPPKPGEGPIVLLDHYDNCASGGTMDTTIVLAAILREGLDNVAAFAIYDPEAVQQAIAAGIGTQVTLSVGGKMKMPAIPGDSPPLLVTGTVKTISSGRFRNKGPMGRGVLTDMGPSVVLDTGKVEIALISRHVEPSDLNCLLALGIDPLQKRYVMLKSRVHWRAGLGALAKSVVDCAGIGVCTSDYGQLTFRNVRRPIYPLDLPNR